MFFTPRHLHTVAFDPNAAEHLSQGKYTQVHTEIAPTHLSNELRGVILQSVCECSFRKFHQTEG